MEFTTFKNGESLNFQWPIFHSYAGFTGGYTKASC